MFGTKKLSTICAELKKAVAADDDNSTQQPKRKNGSAKRKGEGTDVLEELKRFVEALRKEARRKPRSGRRTSMKKKG